MFSAKVRGEQKKEEARVRLSHCASRPWGGDRKSMKGFATLRAVAFWMLCVSCSAQALLAQTPHWIWQETSAPGATGQVVFFRKTFRTPPLLWNSRLTVAADDAAEVFLNGVSVAKCSGPDNPVRAEVSPRLSQGEIVIAVRAANRTGPAGLLLNLNLGGEVNVVSDTSWLVSASEEKDWLSRAGCASRGPTMRGGIDALTGKPRRVRGRKAKLP